MARMTIIKHLLGQAKPEQRSLHVIPDEQENQNNNNNNNL